MGEFGHIPKELLIEIAKSDLSKEVEGESLVDRFFKEHGLDAGAVLVRAHIFYSAFKQWASTIVLNDDHIPDRVKFSRHIQRTKMCPRKRGKDGNYYLLNKKVTHEEKSKVQEEGQETLGN